MAKTKGDPRVLRFVVWLLRGLTGLRQAMFGKASRVDQGDISRFERGEAAPSEDQQRRMAEAARLRWPLVVHLRRFLTALLAAAARQGNVNADSGTSHLERVAQEATRLAVAPYLIEEESEESHLPSQEEAEREAEEIWTGLTRFPKEKWRRLLELARFDSRSWALAKKVSHESERAASDSVAEALELAELSLFIAEQVPEEECRRSRLQGYCWGHIGNARRVANELAGGDEAFLRSGVLWQAGAAAGGDFLPEWRLLDLEASLRRDEQRYSEALDLLGRALAIAGESSAAIGRILLNKEFVLERMGDLEGAAAALTVATPWVEQSRDPHLLGGAGAAGDRRDREDQALGPRPEGGVGDRE